MRNIFRIGIGFLFLLGPVVASAATSISIQSIAPGSTVPAKTNITFNIVASGFSPTIFSVYDAIGTTSISNSNISPVGVVSWTPGVSDVGTHPLTITAADSLSGRASTTLTITVNPPLTISIQSLSPGTSVMPGQKLTFTVSAPGFTNPKFYPSDSFSGSSIGGATIDSSGNFSWTPTADEKGQHTITIYTTDDKGYSAQASQKILVGGGPTLVIQSLAPGSSIPPGQGVSFFVSSSNYSPTAFAVADQFSGTSTSVSNANINSVSGAFNWTPMQTDIGTHVITVTGTVGALGDRASASTTIVVFNPNQPVTPPPAAQNSASSTSGMATSSLNTLQDQLAKLQAQLAVSQASSTPPSGHYVFTKFLSRGSKGKEVLELQNRLVDLGLMHAKPNGNFGPATAAAVKAFQKAHGIKIAGYVGPSTRAALNQ